MILFGMAIGALVGIAATLLVLSELTRRKP